MEKSLRPLIGITGGMGSGKSIICRIFACLGVPIFEADKVAHQLVTTNPVIQQKIKGAFGPESFDDQGTYNRDYIRSRVKNNPDLLSALNHIIHPAVREALQQWAQVPSSAPFKLYEAALLTNKNKPDYIHQLIAVVCPLEERIERLEKRNHLTFEDNMKMLQNQPSYKQYTEGVDLIVKNGKNDRVWPQVEAIFKRLSLILITLLIFSQTSIGQIKAMTFNIRMDTKSDGINQWSNRKDHCAELVKYHQADIIGMQEAFIHQIKDFAERLPGYTWFGRGRDDGKEEGEFSPLFYNTKKFKVLEQKTFWLSDSCDKVGFGWDAACRRVVTWGNFQDLKTKKKFYVFNTHFDHLGKVARRESAKLVLAKIKEIAKNSPVILLGDFNAKPEDEPIQILVDPKNPDRLTNAESISKNGHYGPKNSFNAFKEERENSQIDYIFVKNGVSCEQHATHSETWSNRYPTDHFPVSATLRIP